MQLTAVFLTLAAAAVAVPATPSLKEMQAQFAASAKCHLPAPEEGCSGAARSDVIVTYGMTIQSGESNVFLDAAKAAGGDIVHDWKDFGFAGFVPDHVVELMKRYGKSVGVKIYDNACLQLPICREEPC
jgi:hypothetical protein